MTELDRIIANLTKQFEQTVKDKVAKERYKTVAAKAKIANWRQRAQAYRRELVALRKEMRNDLQVK